MAKASDNVFPKLIFSSGSAPATPSAGQGKVYEKSSDKKLYFKNEDGTEYDLTASGSSSAFVGAKVYRSAAYNLANSAVTAMPWDAEEYDTDGFHDNTTNNSRLTIPTGLGGKYRCSFSIGTDAASAAVMRILGILQVNGATAVRGGRFDFTIPNAGNSFPVLSATCDVAVVAGDYLEVFYYQDSGATKNFHKDWCAFSICKIG